MSKRDVTVQKKEFVEKIVMYRLKSSLSNNLRNKIEMSKHHCLRATNNYTLTTIDASYAPFNMDSGTLNWSMTYTA